MKTVLIDEIKNEGVLVVKGVRLNGGGLNRVLVVTLTNKYILSCNPLQYMFNDKGELDVIKVALDDESFKVLLAYERDWKAFPYGDKYFLDVRLGDYDIDNGQLHEIKVNGLDY